MNNLGKTFSFIIWLIVAILYGILAIITYPIIALYDLLFNND